MDCWPSMATGFHIWMLRTPPNEDKDCLEIIQELAFRIVSANPEQVDQWGKVFEQLGKASNLHFDQEYNYINGSFSVNASPEKRRVAFCMINHLMEVPVC